MNNAITSFVSLPVNITPKEERFINSAFKVELSKNRQKNTTRRNDDNGINAALTCLSRDIVTATPEETILIARKMQFLQSLINNNLQLDANIKSQGNKDSCNMISTKSDCFVKKAPLYSNIIEKTSNGISKVADSASGVVSSIKPINIIA